jgi:hypothetical protein
MSAGTEGLIRGSLIAPTKQSAPEIAPGRQGHSCSLAAVAEQAQQHEEQVDEVEI